MNMDNKDCFVAIQYIRRCPSEIIHQELQEINEFSSIFLDCILLDNKYIKQCNSITLQYKYLYPLTIFFYFLQCHIYVYLIFISTKMRF